MLCAVFIGVTAFAGACSGSKKQPNLSSSPGATGAPSVIATAPGGVTASPIATVTPAADPAAALAAQIGVRGHLPQADAIGLAASYRRTAGRAPASKPFAGEANIGDSRPFVVAKLTSGVLSHQSPPGVETISATLLAKSAHAYFYEDDALGANASDVQAAADAFEASIWPVVTGVFGEPDIPGVDGDPRIVVLQADLGGAVGGYYSGDDQYLRAVRPLSNEAEMVYMDRTLKPGGAAFNVVLAHEFQHLIHAHTDNLEEAWVNEGLSEDSSMLVGGAASTIKSFAAKPATQLNDWDSEGSLPHYGAGAAFFRYLTSRFGGDLSYGLIARSMGDGTAGVDEFLAAIGQTVRFRDVFADWIAANVLNQESGPYGNPGHPLDVRIGHELTAGDAVDGAAHQFGTDYYTLPGLDAREYVLRFRGQTQVPVLPPAALERGPVLWSNAEDGLDTTLTRDVDLTGAVSPALTFQTWIDIERWYDWGYVSVSTDGGQTWQALAGANTTTDDPVAQAYGPGYTGISGGGADPAWLDERISLAAFAGQKIKLRFEYVTDGGTHLEGWAIRNVAIEGTDFRDSDGSAAGWVSQGWLRLDRPLAQTYIVRLIETRSDGGVAVIDVPLDRNQSGELRFGAAGVQDAVLAIAGSTEGTNQQAPYSIQLALP